MNFDFVSVEKEYVNTSCSYRDLALKNGIPLSTLAAYAKKHNWVDKRRSALSSNGHTAADGFAPSYAPLGTEADNNTPSVHYYFCFKSSILIMI